MNQILQFPKSYKPLRDRRLQSIYKKVKSSIDIGVIRMSDLRNRDNIYNSSMENMAEKCKEYANDVEKYNKINDSINEIITQGRTTANTDIDSNISNYDLNKVYAYVQKIKKFMQMDDSPKLVSARLIDNSLVDQLPLTPNEKQNESSPRLNTSTTSSRKRKLIKVKITVPKKTFKYKSSDEKKKINATFPASPVRQDAIDQDKNKTIDAVVNNTKEEKQKLNDFLLNESKTTAETEQTEKDDAHNNTMDVFKSSGKKEKNEMNISNRANIAHSSLNENKRVVKQTLHNSFIKHLSPIQSSGKPINLSLPAAVAASSESASRDSEIIKDLVMSRFESSFNKSRTYKRASSTRINDFDTTHQDHEEITSSEPTNYHSCFNTTGFSSPPSATKPTIVVTDAQIEHVDELSKRKPLEEITHYITCDTENESQSFLKPMPLQTVLNKEEPIYTPVRKVRKFWQDIENACVKKPKLKEEAEDLEKIIVCDRSLLNTTFTKYDDEDENKENIPPSIENTDFNTAESETSFSSFGPSMSTMDASLLVSQGGTCYYKPAGKPFPKLWKNNDLISMPTYESVNITEEAIAELEHQPDPERVKALTKKADQQEDIMRQTSNAIYMYKHTNTSVSAQAQIEAEKVLLLALLRRRAYLQEIPRLGYEEIVDPSMLNLGTVYITDVSFPVKPEVSKQNQTLNHKEWLFICVVHCGETVISSDIVQGSDSNEIRINKSFVFDGVTPDFEVNLSVYAMKKPKDKKAKRRILTTKCFRKIERTINKIRRFTNKYCPHRSRSYVKKNYPQMSSFMKWGHLQLRFCDLSRNFNWKMNRVPSYATLTGYVNMNISSAVNIANKMNGFLNVATEVQSGCKEWNRRWCVLDGPIVSFWNYPHEEDESPVKTLDLRFCINNAVTQASREYCARPRSLLLETVPQPNGLDESRRVDGSAIIRYYLSADNLAEMHAWEKELNSVILSLRYWNAAKCKLICAQEA